MKHYLGRADVKTAVHVPHAGKDATWEECDTAVHTHLGGDVGVPSYTLLPRLLERVEVLLFNGDKDLICNWRGLYDMVENLSWQGIQGMNNAPKQDWLLDSHIQGWYQTSRNLTFVLKSNASHMMPVDAPEASLDMLNRFMNLETRDPLDVPVGVLVDSGGGVVSGSTATMKGKVGAATTSLGAVKFVPGKLGDELEEGIVDTIEEESLKREAASSFGAGVIYLSLVALVIVFLSFRSNRVRMELGTTGEDEDDEESEAPIMADDELDDMLQLESGPASARRR
ncbi:Cell death protease [Podochytrium sp. JEL0797]|nr:Cell death protease [Podochytrium sp. JEL0797]